jgi:hypothetical protein
MVACVAFANAQDEAANARRMATNFFERIDNAINKGKVDTYFTMLAPGYYTVDTEGHRMNVPQLKSMVAGMMRATRGVHSETVVKNVQLMDQEEVVWTEQTMTWSEKKGNGWVKMKETTRWAENLKMVGGAWRLASSQQLMTNEPWSFKTN